MSGRPLTMLRADVRVVRFGLMDRLRILFRGFALLYTMGARQRTTFVVSTKLPADPSERAEVAALFRGADRGKDAERSGLLGGQEKRVRAKDEAPNA